MFPSLRPLLLLAALLAPLSAAEYALILKNPPLAARVTSRAALQSTAARSHSRLIATNQNALRSELARRRIAVTGSVQTLLNAVFVRVPAGREAELRAMPGVDRVAYLPALRRHLDRAVQLTQVPAAWNAVGGVDNAGAGVKIAVIDTGIDQNHAAFQDAALAVPAGFPKGDAAFTNRKVIVARSYVAQLATANAQPDDNSPRDRVGHGTAIAMIAAGERTAAPLATITGVAPKAWLGNYKIYGSPGVNDQTSSGALIQALEDALGDGMDIAALATGDPAGYGPLDRASGCASDPPVALRPYIPADSCDVRALAVENAIKMGLAVVVSAGDDGSTLGTINSPGTAPSAITVGGTTNSHRFFATVNVTGLRQFDALPGSGPRPPSPLTAPVRDSGLACGALGAGSLTGAIALIQRGTCPFDVKVNNAQAAGAVGVLLYQISGDDTLFTPANLGDTAIPLFFVTNASGAAIQTFLRANATASVTLDPTLHAEDAPFDTVADFSSRGPAIGSLAIKPELAAPAADLYTATQKYDPNGDLYDPSGFTAVSGNSFSVPLVAGAAALVKQAHPGYTPAQLKSAVVNSATANIQDSQGAARAASVGAGKLNGGGAVLAGATVDPATLSFGAIAAGALPLSRVLTVTNTGSGAATFAVSVAARDADNNARLSVSPASLPLNPGQSGAVTVQLAGSRPVAGSYEGQINITGGGTSLRIPYLYLVGDGVARNIAPIFGNGIVGALNETGDFIGFRLTDRYGVPVVNAPVTFRVGTGGGKIESADTATDVYGIGAGFVDLGSQAGDQIFFADAGGLTQEFDLTARPQPALSADSVVDAASFQTAAQSGHGFAPGSYITINGANFSPAALSFHTPYLPIFLAGVSVGFEVPGTGITAPGHISFVNGSQINVLLPWELQGRSSASMKVTVNGVTSAAVTVPLSDAAPALFEFDDAASGRRIAAALGQDGGVITSSRPAQRGRAISLYANGLGPVSNQPASGEATPLQPLAVSRVTPTVSIGGRAVQVLFSGLAPGFAGLYQIDLSLPADLPSGAQLLVVSVNGIDSKPSSIFLN